MKRILYLGLGLTAASLMLLLSLTLPSATALIAQNVTAPSAATIVITDPGDSGTGTLRQALLDAQPGDTITFDPTAFPSGDPVTITLDSALPGVTQDYLVLSGKGAGVIIEGSNLPDAEFRSGIEVISAVSVTVEGLEIVNFPGSGIVLAQSADSLVQGNVLRGNELGLGTWDAGAARNLIRSNEIYSCNIGVSVSHGAHEIVIEGNTIHDNDEFGVAITHEGSSAQVTENRIYDNGDPGLHLTNSWRGIYIDGPDDPPAAPLIADFDLATGAVAGVACPQCRVEIFSSEEAQGQRFAGSTVADAQGEFALSGLSFEHDRLTATATDDEMTGPFSEPTTGTQQMLLLQLDNTRARQQFVGDPVEEGAFNGLGEMYSLAPTVFGATPEQFVDQAMDVGLTWERVSLDEFDFHEDWQEQTGRAPWSTEVISDKQESALQLLQENGFEVMYTLLFWDEQIEPYLDDPGYTRFADQAEIDRFISYTTFIVEHLGPYIDWYEIWNEPETDDPGQFITVTHYVSVVEQLLPVIERLDPEAGVVVGATPDYDFVFQLIESDIISEVEGISWHPFYGNAPGLDLEGWPPNYWEDYPALLRQLEAEARAHGFRGEFMAEEMNWLTPLNAPPLGYAGHDAIPAAKYLGRAIVLHRGMGAWSGLAESYSVHPKGPTVRNLADLLAEAEPTTMTLSLSTSATNTVTHTFGSPRGEMVAFWDDDVAANSLAPGSRGQIVTATLSILADPEQDLIVRIIDPLNGLQQEAEVTRQGEQLKLPDLVLKDYPLMVVVSPRQYVYLPLVRRQ